MKQATEKLITEHLDTWSSAIKAKSSAGRGGGKKQEFYGVKKLRELILELAVRGLLVPQDPNDEPASELLKKITKEKAKLVKDGKIKKGKILPAPSINDLGFESPNGWLWVRLQEVTEYIQRGKGPKYSDVGSVQVVSQKCIQWMGFDSSVARSVCDESLDKYQPERFLRSNDLLWNSTGTGTAGRINRIDNIAENTLVADSHVTIVRTLDFHSGFICCYISSPSIQMQLLPAHENSLVSGTTNQVELNTSSVISLPIPLPPLAEQHRIVAKVDELMALCDQLEQQQEDSVRTHGTLVQTLLGALTAASERGQFPQAWQRIEANFDTLFTTESSIDQLKQTILQLAVMGKLVEQDPEDEPAFALLKRIAAEKAKLVKAKKIKKQKELPRVTIETQPFSIPPSWAWANFYEIIESLKYGTSKKCYANGEGRPVLRIPNLQNGRLSGENLKYTKLTVEEIEQLALKTQDLLIIRSNGSLSLVGRSARVSQNFEGCAYAGYLVRARTLPSKFQIDFLHILFESPLVREQIEVPIRHGVGLKNINSMEISRIKISIPPLAEQHRIVAKVDELMTLCDRLKATLQTAQSTQLHLADTLVVQSII